MDSKTYSLHINESFIRRVDQHAEKMRRSRNSLICEAIEILLEQYDAPKPKPKIAEKRYPYRGGTR